MITSTSNQKIKQIVQWQGSPGQRRKDKVFLAEGFRMFEEAPREWIRAVYLSRDAARELSREQEKLNQTGYEIVSEDVFRKMSDTQTPQGILTVLKQPEYQLADLLAEENPLFLLLENIQDPGNLGTMIRTGEGAGITGVILSPDTVDVYNPKTVRATMGSIYRVPFFYVDSLAETIVRLQDAGVETYAAHLKGRDLYDSFSFRTPTAFLVGNEGSGLREETAGVAAHSVKIPMEGKLESLNAAVSAALLMYEAHRQRNRK